MGWQDAPIVEEKQPAWKAAPEVEQPSTAAKVDRFLKEGADRVGRQVGLTARAGVHAVTGLGEMVGNALGTHSTQAVDQLLDTLGLPKPENPTERIAGDVASAMAGQGAFVKAGGVLAKAAEPVVSRVGQVLSSSPGLQTAAAGGGAAAQGTTREQGGGPVAQTAAGLGASALVPVAVLRGAPAILEAATPKGGAQTAAATLAAKEAGFKPPPTQANPSLLNQIVEGVAGKIKTGQALSIENQVTGNSRIKRAFGLAEDAPLNAQTFNQVRKEAGAAYTPVRGSGRVAADADYTKALDKVAAPFESAAKDFSESARTDILDAVKAARKPSFDASSAVDEIQNLRDKAGIAYAKQDKKLGRAYRDISEAMEDQLDRHLQQSGYSPDVIKNFQNARKTIAQTYTVEKYVQPNGDVDMQGLAAELKRKPLAGEIKTVAEFGKNFPKAAQLPQKIGGIPTSPWEHYLAGGGFVGSMATGHPLAALASLAPYGRIGARNLLLSKFYQDRFVNPPAPGPSRLQELQQRPLVPALAGAEAQQQ